LWKSALVSAVSTSAINFAGAQVGRKVNTTTDLLELAINKGLAKLGRPSRNPNAINARAAWSDILGYTGAQVSLMKMVKRDIREIAAASRLAYSHDPTLSTLERSVAQKVLNENPTEWERLFRSYNSDINMRKEILEQALESSEEKNQLVAGLQNVANATDFAIAKALSAGEYLFDKANFLNKLQEFWMRDMEFTRSLQKQLSGRGIKLDDIIENKEWDKIRPEEIARAVDEALKITFATPAPKDSRIGKNNKLDEYYAGC
jgi:hypothetical protein